ncbi:hypothetical protein ACLOJK_037865 [Asimina triloba]
METNRRLPPLINIISATARSRRLPPSSIVDSAAASTQKHPPLPVVVSATASSQRIVSLPFVLSVAGYFLKGGARTAGSRIKNSDEKKFHKLGQALMELFIVENSKKLSILLKKSKTDEAASIASKK